VKRGRVVDYTFRDPITGARLDGIGVAVAVPEDGAAIAILPLQSNYLYVAPGDVRVVELDG
jgi:hypothetical protein